MHACGSFGIMGEGTEATQLSTVTDIERAIAGLNPQELEELYVWLDEHLPQPIDAHLKADLEAGQIDDRIERALADHRAGNTKPL